MGKVDPSFSKVVWGWQIEQVFGRSDKSRDTQGKSSSRPKTRKTVFWGQLSFSTLLTTPKTIIHVMVTLDQMTNNLKRHKLLTNEVKFNQNTTKRANILFSFPSNKYIFTSLLQAFFFNRVSRNDGKLCIICIVGDRTVCTTAQICRWHTLFSHGKMMAPSVSVARKVTFDATWYSEEVSPENPRMLQPHWNGGFPTISMGLEHACSL